MNAATPRQAEVRGPSHYALNGWWTGCGQPLSPGGSHSHVDHGPATTREDRIGCAACRAWLAAYRDAFPRGETLPVLEDVAAAHERSKEAAYERKLAWKAEREARREVWEAAEYRRSR